MATIAEEVVHFRADGIEEVIARAKAMGIEIEGVGKKAGDTFALAADEAGNAMEKARRTAAAASVVATGSGTGTASRTSPRAIALAEQERAAKRAAAAETILQGAMRRTADIARTAYANRERFVNAIQQLPEYARMGQGALGYAGVGVGIGAGALAARGFQGTTESARLDREYELLGREIAGVFKPVIDGLTGLFKDMRQWMASRTEREQDRMLQGAATGVGAVVGGKMLGLGGAAAGAAIGFGLTSENIGEREAAKRMRSVLSSQSREDFRRRIGEMNAESRYSYADVIPFYGLNERNRKDSLGRMASSVSASVEFGNAKTIQELDQERERLRGEATTRPTLFQTITDPLNPFSIFRKANEFSQTRSRFGAIDEAYNRRYDELTGKAKPASANDERRMVTPANPVYSDIGGTYDTAQLELLKLGSDGGVTPEKQLDDIAKILSRIEKNTASDNGNAYTAQNRR